MPSTSDIFCSQTIMNVMSDCNVMVGTNSVRGIYDQPAKQVTIMGEGVASSDPSVSVLDTDVNNLEIKKGTSLTIIRDNAPSVPLDYVVKYVDGDGAGLSALTLKKVQP